MKINRSRAFIAALFVSASCLPLIARAETAADQNEGKDVVVTGQKAFGVKSGIPLAKMPQSVQVLSDQDIVANGARSLEDLLRAVPSATVARSRVAGFGGNTLRIRGFAAQQIRNGIYQRFYDGTDPSALSNIERVEVLKGPSGVLYGQSGLGGIVSTITKQPTKTFQGEAALTLGSYDQKLASLDLGGPISDTFGVRLTAEIERSGSFVDHLDVERENIGLTFAWRPNDRVSAYLVGEYLYRKTLNNPGLPTVGTVLGNGVATVKRSTFLGEPAFSLQENDAPLIQSWADIRLSDAWTLTPRLQYSGWKNTGRSTTLLAPSVGQLTTIPRVGRNAGEDDSFWVAQLDLAGSVKAGSTDHRLLIGAEYSHDDVPFQMQGTVPCGIGAINALNPVYGCGAPTSNFAFVADAKLEGVAVYVQDQIAVTDAWTVVAGIRHSQADNDNTFTTAFGSTPSSARLSNTTWQLGTTYALGGGVSLYGGYNTGYDLGAVTGSRRFDGTPFKPETSDQAEAGVRLSRETLSASLSVFQVRRNNVGVPDPANIGFQVQGGQFRVRGVEVEGTWSPLPNWSLQGGYAWLDGVVSESTTPALVGARLAETPEHSATLTSRWTAGRFEIRTGANYVGARKMINGGAVTLPAYTTVDLGVGTILGTTFGDIRIDAVLSNVFDETYYYSDNLSRYSLGTEDRVLPGEPRTFSLRLSRRFGGAR